MTARFPGGVKKGLSGGEKPIGILPGQYFDAETGLNYNYFRDYNPGIGRYVEADPIGLRGGLNPFAYVQNNPVNLVDSYGLEASFGGGYGLTMFAGWNRNAWGVDASVSASISRSGITISFQGTNITKAYGGYVGWGKQSNVGLGDPCPKGLSISGANSMGAAGGWEKGGSASLTYNPDGVSLSGGGARVGGGYGGGVWAGETLTGSWSWKW